MEPGNNNCNSTSKCQAANKSIDRGHTCWQYRAFVQAISGYRIWATSCKWNWLQSSLKQSNRAGWARQTCSIQYTCSKQAFLAELKLWHWPPLLWHLLWAPESPWGRSQHRKGNRLGARFFWRGGEWKREGGNVALLLIYHCTVMNTNLYILGIYMVPFRPLTNVTAVGLSWPSRGLGTTTHYFEYGKWSRDLKWSLAVNRRKQL